MTPLIAGKGWSVYPDRMAATLLRILTLFALTMMPFGMVPAPAAASPAPHHAMDGMAGHCDEGDESDDGKAERGVHCALACSAMTPDATAAPIPVEMVASRPSLPHVAPFVGRQPEADPPPPKLA